MSKETIRPTGEDFHEGDFHLSDRLKMIRFSAGLSQREMAKLLALSMRAYCYIENGTRDMGSSKINRLLSLWNIDANWFLFGELSTGDVPVKTLSSLGVTPA